MPLSKVKSNSVANTSNLSIASANVSGNVSVTGNVTSNHISVSSVTTPVLKLTGGGLSTENNLDVTTASGLARGFKVGALASINSNYGYYGLENGTVAAEQQLRVYGQSRLNFYAISTGDSGSNRYIHFKTNSYWNSTQMYSVKFNGHCYGASQVIDAGLSWYTYWPSGGYTNVGSSGTHTCGIYKASDGYIVMTLFVSNIYYTAISLSQYLTTQGLADLTITAWTHSASSTGVY